jgi:hypothetical protein
MCVCAHARAYVHMYVHIYVTNRYETIYSYVDMKRLFMDIRPVMISAKQNKCMQAGTLNNIL